jgi:uncharacterized protein (UPF0332 family)
MLWSEFQDTAGRLAQGTTEGDWRSGISRAYYAVFHFFREFLRSHRLDIGKGGQAHFNLYTGLWNCGFPTVVTIARKVNDLRYQRLEADYDLHHSIGQREALNSVQTARAIVADFQAALTTISAVDIVDAARRYLKAIGHLGPTP